MPHLHGIVSSSAITPQSRQHSGMSMELDRPPSRSGAGEVIAEYGSATPARIPSSTSFGERRSRYVGKNSGSRLGLREDRQKRPRGVARGRESRLCRPIVSICGSPTANAAPARPPGNAASPRMPSPTLSMSLLLYRNVAFMPHAGPCLEPAHPALMVVYWLRPCCDFLGAFATRTPSPPSTTSRRQRSAHRH